MPSCPPLLRTRSSVPVCRLVGAFLLAASALLFNGAALAGVWTIPGTVNAGGLNNTRFVSDLAVTNPGSVPVQATISFLPADGTTPEQVTLNAGQTVVYRNILDSLWGAQGAGATQVASDSPLLIRARTYNTAASGTFGVALPVFANDRLLSAGDMAHSLWISQSADGTAGYRTNVAVVFPDLGGGSATVTVYDAEGNEVGSQDFDMDSRGIPAVRGRRLRGRGLGRAGAGAGHARPGRGIFRRRRQRHGGFVALRVRGPARGSPGRARERRGPGERKKQHVLPDGRPLLQPRNGRRDHFGRLPRKPEQQPGSLDEDVHRSRREGPRRGGRAGLAARPPGRLRGRPAVHVRRAGRDPVPYEQRGPGRASSPARSARSRSPRRSSRS